MELELPKLETPLDWEYYNQPTWDERYTDVRIGFLHPLFRHKARTIINMANWSYDRKFRITRDGHLRSPATQERLWQQGRTPKGNVVGHTVTNARAWQSIHNYGFAVDCVLIEDNGQPIWKSAEEYELLHAIGRHVGAVPITPPDGWDAFHLEDQRYNDWRTLKAFRDNGKTFTESDAGPVYVDVTNYPNT